MKWIKLEDQLPIENSEVFVFIRGNIRFLEFSHGIFHHVDGINISYEPTHWMYKKDIPIPGIESNNKLPELKLKLEGLNRKQKEAIYSWTKNHTKSRIISGINISSLHLSLIIDEIEKDFPKLYFDAARNIENINKLGE